MPVAEAKLTVVVLAEIVEKPHIIIKPPGSFWYPLDPIELPKEARLVNTTAPVCAESEACPLTEDTPVVSVLHVGTPPETVNTCPEVPIARRANAVADEA